MTYEEVTIPKLKFMHCPACDDLLMTEYDEGHMWCTYCSKKVPKEGKPNAISHMIVNSRFKVTMPTSCCDICHESQQGMMVKLWGTLICDECGKKIIERVIKEVKT